MIVRPTIVYGIADRLGLTPRLIVGAVYAYLKEKMKVSMVAPPIELIGYIIIC